MFINNSFKPIALLDYSEDRTSTKSSISQVTDVIEAKADGNCESVSDKILESKESTERNSQNAILKKIGKKIRLRKKKKREVKQKKTENRARKALKTIRQVIYL